jgi:hypothetical protein
LRAIFTTLTQPMETIMDKTFLNSLLGPFPMSMPPVRGGFYAVDVGGRTEMWHWSLPTQEWSDRDDGLGERLDPATARGWYGQRPPPTTDGL